MSQARRPKLLLYLGQLLLPALLLLDIAVTWRLQRDELYRPFSDKLLILACGAWMVVALAPLLLSRDRDGFLQRTSRFITGFCSLVVLLAVVEIGLRLFVPAPNAVAALRPPDTSTAFRPADAHVPVSGISHFTVNEIGLRGPSVPRDRGVYRIIALGSSTTEDAVQDDSREWPHLLMQELNAEQQHTRVWVANAGVSGHTTVHNLTVMETLPVFSQIDAVVMVLGQTDMGTTLVFHGQPTQAALERDAAVLRQSMLSGGKPFFDHPYYKRLRLYDLGKRAGLLVLKKAGHAQATDQEISLNEWRQRRAKATLRPLPDLSIGLQEYKQRVRSLAAECTRLRVRCVFATQPTLWRADLDAKERATLWGGRLGRSQDSDAAGYASLPDLTRAMHAWHSALLEVCAQDKLECIDLAAKVPQTNAMLYDDSHMTDAGAQAYADVIAGYFLSTPPLASSPPGMQTATAHPARVPGT